MEKEKQNKIVLFQEKEIRRTWHNDVVAVLSESKNPNGYLRDMR